MSGFQRFLVTRAENGGFMVQEKSPRMGEHEPPVGCFTNPADCIAWLTAKLMGSKERETVPAADIPFPAGRVESATLAPPRASTADLDQADRFARIRSARPQEGDGP